MRAKARPGSGPAPASGLQEQKQAGTSSGATIAGAVAGARKDGDPWHALTNGNPQRGIPVREALQTMYALRRDKAFRELLLYTVFFGLFIVVSHMMMDIHRAYEQDDTVIDRLFDEEFVETGGTFRQTFTDIMTQEEFWKWLQGPVTREFLQNEYYNGEPLPPSQMGYTASFLRIVGEIQLRQVRGSNSSCYGRRFVGEGDRFDTKDGTCFDYFDAGESETREPFGPNGMYTWSGGWSNLGGLYGFGQEYGTGGFVTYLSVNQTRAKEQVAELKRNLWVDRSTRVVALNTNLYNTNTRLLTVVRAVVEFFPSGRVLPWFRVYATVPALYFINGITDGVRKALELCFVVMLLYYVQKEAKRWYWTQPHWRYFTQIKNLFEVLSLGSALTMVGCQLALLGSTLRQGFSVADPHYVDYYPVAVLTEAVLVSAAVFALTSFLKVFKYTALNKRMNTLWLTLYSALSDLVAFIAAYLFILLGFSYAGFLVFGTQLRDYHNLVTAFSTLNRYILGDFDYAALWNARPRLAAPFFGLYTVLVLLTVTNIFIAVLMRNFETVQTQSEEETQWKSTSVSVGSSLMRRLWRTYRRLCRRDAEWTADELHEWERRGAFRKQLGRVMSGCKRVKGLDLFDYFHRLFLESSGENQYVGLHELCAIVRGERECDHRNCQAGHLVALYHGLKDVVLVSGRAHIPSSYSARTLAGHNIYRVEKTNKEGRRQTRLVVVDCGAMEVRTYDTRRRYRKTLFLGFVRQIERSRVNFRRVTLVFAGQQAPYTFVFQDARERDDFVRKVLSAAKAAQPEPDPATVWLTGDSPPRNEDSILKAAATEARRSQASLLSPGPRVGPSEEKSAGAGADAGGEGGVGSQRWKLLQSSLAAGARAKHVVPAFRSQGVGATAGGEGTSAEMTNQGGARSQRVRRLSAAVASRAQLGVGSGSAAEGGTVAQGRPPAPSGADSVRLANLEMQVEGLVEAQRRQEGILEEIRQGLRQLSARDRDERARGERARMQQRRRVLQAQAGDQTAAVINYG